MVNLWRGFLYNQTEAVLAQYEIEIREIIKGRGCHICDTNQGMKVLVPFNGSKDKGEFLKEYLKCVNESGFFVEQIMPNINGEAVTEEEGSQERFILKSYVSGTELDTGRFKEMEEAICLLAKYHNVSQKIELVVPEKMKDSVETVVDSRQRHYRELIKVKNYIRNRKKKNEFEQIYMRNFLPMLTTAENSMNELLQQAKANPKCDICHGDFNQHNVVCENHTWHMIHFESFTYTWSVMDLANFLRKMLEKNNWDVTLGMHLIECYDKNCALQKEELGQLYGLLLFPEKFWKITNHYMHSRKSWISQRDIDKLKKVIEQETQRLNFMEKLFSIL